MSHIEKVKEFIVGNFLFGEGGQLANDTPFFGSGFIDSTGILEVVLFIEETYGITVEDDELTPQNFFSLETVGRFLERKMNGHAD
jgi:acyl carrier protein